MADTASAPAPTMLDRFVASRSTAHVSTMVGASIGRPFSADAKRPSPARYNLDAGRQAAPAAPRRPIPGTGSKPSSIGARPGAGGGVGFGLQGPPPSLNIVAVCENRSREVGIAATDLRNMSEVQLSQVTDTQSYATTMAMLALHDPTEVVVSRSMEGRVLHKKIQAHWERHAMSKITVLSRKHFDDTMAVSQLHNLSAAPLASEASSRYLALASAAALLSFVEHIQNISIAPRSLRVAVDVDTVRALEVLSNAVDGTAKGSLFQCINRTKTTVGCRLLRANLLSPCNELSTLQARLDCVEELLTNQPAFFSATDILTKTVDLDLLLSHLVQQPRVSTPRTARRAIQAVIDLKHTLDRLPVLSEALSGSSNPLLKLLRGNLESQELAETAQLINHVLMPDTARSSSAALMRQQECFAVRKGVDGDLDAVRTVYMDVIATIHAVAEQYKEEWACPHLRLHYTVSRGYHLVLPKGFPPPLMCIQVVSNRATAAATTEDLASLNSRAKEALDNVYCITHRILDDVLAEVRTRMSALFLLSDSIAYLDMVASFAAVVRHSHNEFARSLHVEQGRRKTVLRVVCEFEFVDPVLDAATDKPFVPNDMILRQGRRLLLLTGANNSGKSTYMHQVALLTILAHVGCYLPAKSATIPLFDRLLVRMGTSDDMEANASSFLVEMKDTASIVQRVTPHSMVLMDELGRSTSHEHGVGIAWAVCELLLATGCYTVFVTHYHQLAALATLYPAAANVCTEVHVPADGGAGGEPMRFVYRVSSGTASATSRYGIAMARACGMPADVTKAADAIAKRLTHAADTTAA